MVKIWFKMISVVSGAVSDLKALGNYIRDVEDEEDCSILYDDEAYNCFCRVLEKAVADLDDNAVSTLGQFLVNLVDFETKLDSEGQDTGALWANKYWAFVYETLSKTLESTDQEDYWSSVSEPFIERLDDEEVSVLNLYGMAILGVLSEHDIGKEEMIWGIFVKYEDPIFDVPAESEVGIVLEPVQELILDSLYSQEDVEERAEAFMPKVQAHGVKGRAGASLAGITVNPLLKQGKARVFHANPQCELSSVPRLKPISGSTLANLKRVFTPERPLVIALDLDETLWRYNRRTRSVTLRPYFKAFIDRLVALKKSGLPIKIGIWSHASNVLSQYLPDELRGLCDFIIFREDAQEKGMFCPKKQGPKDLYAYSQHCDLGLKMNPFVIFLDDRKENFTRLNYHRPISRFENTASTRLDYGLMDFLMFIDEQLSAVEELSDSQVANFLCEYVEGHQDGRPDEKWWDILSRSGPVQVDAEQNGRKRRAVMKER